ncbi:hypothetical protein FA15DRAFT_253039 [Coprinopsis marcescibilis]|uniref:Dienelactone hydrolase domain-containing protein n=1 Tax=Coprinopsis marcescibilis TaxID=230819 RepID=A0A5C3KET0_COPMA|nr:hypothetical protein FA15DRAFT_253039 [Coprinopsis marcescibilis]
MPQSHCTIMRLFTVLLALPLAFAFPSTSPNPKRSTSPILATDINKDCINKPNHLLAPPAPRGKNITLADVPTYVVTPPVPPGSPGLPGPPITITPRPPKVILFLSDVYSPFDINNQLVQDGFAAAGFHVLGLDYFYGDPISKHEGASNEELMAWLAKSRAQCRKFPNCPIGGVGRSSQGIPKSRLSSA